MEGVFINLINMQRWVTRCQARNKGGRGVHNAQAAKFFSHCEVFSYSEINKIWEFENHIVLVARYVFTKQDLFLWILLETEISSDFYKCWILIPYIIVFTKISCENEKKILTLIISLQERGNKLLNKSFA